MLNTAAWHEKCPTSSAQFRWMGFVLLVCLISWHLLHVQLLQKPGMSAWPGCTTVWTLLHRGKQELRQHWCNLIFCLGLLGSKHHGDGHGARGHAWEFLDLPSSVKRVLQNSDGKDTWCIVVWCICLFWYLGTSSRICLCIEPWRNHDSFCVCNKCVLVKMLYDTNKLIPSPHS